MRRLICALGLVAAAGCFPQAPDPEDGGPGINARQDAGAPAPDTSGELTVLLTCESTIDADVVVRLWVDGVGVRQTDLRMPEFSTSFTIGPEKTILAVIDASYGIAPNARTVTDTAPSVVLVLDGTAVPEEFDNEDNIIRFFGDGDLIEVFIPQPGDECPQDPNKFLEGFCGCFEPEFDGDGDGLPDCVDGCPDDAGKTDEGQCGCGNPDTDRDGDGTADCIDGCPDDPFKIAEGVCGCGVADDDRDGDGVLDCLDECPDDPDKTEEGVCGCGAPDLDVNRNNVIDCVEPPPSGGGGGGVTPVPDQACCFPNGSCSDLDPSECSFLGGVPQGPGSACGEGTCPVEATVSFVAAASSIGESAGAVHQATLVLNLISEAVTLADIMVDVVDLGTGTADGGDYTSPLPDTALFPAGSGDGATVVVDALTPQGDPDVEGDETVDLKLQNIIGPAAIGSPSSHTVTITDDDVPSPPSVTVDQAPTQPDPTHTGPIRFVATFSEPVTGFADGDVDLSASTTGGTLVCTVTEIAPLDGTTYEAGVTGMAGDGSVIASVPAGVAQSGGGVGNTASTSTDHTVAYDSTPPLLTGAVSRLTHGTLGELELGLALGAPPSAEGRLGGPRKVVLTFSEDVVAADATPDGTEVSLSGGTLDGVSIAGSAMTILMSSVPDESCLVITLSGLEDLAGNPLAGDSDVSIRVVAGDATNDGQVLLNDFALVKLRAGQAPSAVDPGNVDDIRKDITHDGSILLNDVALVKLNNGHSATSGCP